MRRSGLAIIILVTVLTTFFVRPVLAPEYPDADAGGPYECVVGTQITLEGSCVGFIDPLFRWDLDYDGDYDTSGQVIHWTFTSPGTYTILLNVIDLSDKGFSGNEFDITTVVVHAFVIPEMPIGTIMGMFAFLSGLIFWRKIK